MRNLNTSGLRIVDTFDERFIKYSYAEKVSEYDQETPQVR